MATTHRIKWPSNPASENVTAYQIWNSFNGGPIALFQEVAPIAGAEQTFDRVDPTPGAWVYKIAARNAVGVGEVSEPTAAPGVPSKVGQPTLEVITT